MPELVLASSSSYRRALLEKLGLPFATLSPDIDECALPGEMPEGLVVRLACAKARKVAMEKPGALIIGSDQVAVGPDGQVLGKPHVPEKAIAQLQSMSGRSVTFLTGLCLLNAVTGNENSLYESFRVRFRKLSPAQIRRYVEKENPLDCAGSFKSEGFGITLFESLEGRDPNSLVGLPLIALVGLLEREGILLP
jgi:septum formation protein